MEKFFLLIRDDIDKLRNMSPEEYDRCIRIMSGWGESLADSGNFIMSEPLKAIGRYVKQDVVASDGPFIEAKEAVSGYFMINAENLEQAAAIAQTCPMVMSGELAIEVRPIILFENGNWLR
jgi:hypothetical protein